ncbi:MAG: hypothetical protein ACXADA_21475 [Candidatus Hodarchaeales archaeon]
MLELPWKPVTRASPVLRVHEPGDIPKRNPPAFSWRRMSRVLKILSVD